MVMIMTGTGMIHTYPCPKKESLLEKPRMGSPPEMMKATPRRAVIVPSVATSGGMNSSLTISPFTRPKTADIARVITTTAAAGMPASMALAVNGSDADDGPHGKVYPASEDYERIPTATMPTTATCRRIFRMFSVVKNTGDSNPNSKDRATSTRMMPYVPSTLRTNPACLVSAASPESSGASATLSVSI